LATDFFQQQDVARRSTTRLIVLFALAVLAIVVSLEVLLAATMGYLSRNPDTGAIDWAAVTDPALFLVAAAGTLIVVGGGSLYKMAELRAGGSVVAEQLGGRLLTSGTADLVEQQLLNVVEEMALASGTPTPPVYMMDQEEGINAFAAGFSPHDAVIGVTRGTATRLTRDELQGVIAHEFSHILNGDMRMNIRLMGLLHGILIIGMLGYFILRMSFYSGGRRSRSGKDNGLPIMAIGAGLAVIGFAGTFFGNLIKAAVSRQREFLADASAVQFTRQPEGIAGALKKIGGFVKGAAIDNPNAPLASHMFFGEATSGFTSLFATHPPLSERIKRIDPSWNGEFPDNVSRTDGTLAPAAVAAGASGFAGGQAASGLAGAVATIGQPGPQHVHYAAGLIESLPPALVAAARETYSARAVVYTLLLDSQPEIRQQQLGYLEHAAERGLFGEAVRLLPLVARLDATMRLPLLEIALPSLRAMTTAQRALFEERVVALIEADSRIDLFEWCLHRILARDVETVLGAGRRTRVRFPSVSAVRTQCQLLMSTLAYVGQRDAGKAGYAYGRAMAALALTDAPMLTSEECGLAELDDVLDELDEAAPSVKRTILEAAVACIAADRAVTAAEAELLRAVSASISCPMPPIILN
jgi:Zn-dependent protease with chaperone function